jgi:hypothetical protein
MVSINQSYTLAAANNIIYKLFHHKNVHSQSLASSMPTSEMENCASDSGNTGEHAILAMRFSPRPLRSASRVVDACAMMFPPMGFNALAPANIALPSGFATTCK